MLKASLVYFNLVAIAVIATRYNKVSGKKNVKLSMKKRQVPDRFLDQRGRERKDRVVCGGVSLRGKGTHIPPF